MDPEPFVSRLLDDEGLTGELAGASAERLVAWLAGRAERLAAGARSAAEARSRVAALARRGRELARAAAKAADPLAALEVLLAQEPGGRPPG